MWRGDLVPVPAVRRLYVDRAHWHWGTAHVTSHRGHVKVSRVEWRGTGWRLELSTNFREVYTVPREGPYYRAFFF